MTLTDAQARAAFSERFAVPSHVGMCAIAVALNKTGDPLAEGVEARLGSEILLLWFRKTWRRVGEAEPVLNPYQPPNVSHAALRSLEGRLALSISDAAEGPLRAFAAAIAPPLVRARFFDVLWERFRKPDDAAAAIDAFLDYVAIATADDSWTDVEDALGRAAVLVAARKDVARVNALLAAFDHAAVTVLGGQFYFAYACLANTFAATVLGAKAIREQIPRPLLQRWGFVLTWLADSFFGKDAHYGQMCFRILAEWWRSRRDLAQSTAARRRLVEHLLASAVEGSALVGSSHASAALLEARHAGFTDLIERAKIVIQDRILASHAEMQVSSFAFTLPPEVVAELENVVDGAPTAGHAVHRLGALVGLCDIPVTQFRSAAAQQMSQSVFSALVPSMHMRAGKIAFLASDPETKLREAIARNIGVHLALVEHLLDHALQRLTDRITPSTMWEAVAGCPWLPRSTGEWLARASERFHAGDMVSSGLIVAMQYEAVLRQLARSLGASGLKTDGDGTLLDETLGSLLRHKALLTAVGEDHLFFVEHVIGDPSLGLNLRNELAHGNAAASTLTPSRVLLLWLFIIRLTCFGPPGAASRSICGEVSDEEVERAAYFRWLEGGRADGHDVEDWLLAEHDLRPGTTRS